MASKRELEVGIRIGATDEASDVVKGMTKNMESSLGSMAGGYLYERAGGFILNQIGGTVDAFADQENALARVRIMTMKRGQANDEVFAKEKQWITELSSTYMGSVSDYAKMTETLLRYRLSPEDIMGGVGETAAKLGVVFDVGADKAAMFFGKMKNDFKIPVSEMNQSADMLSKVHRMGVGLTGEDAINEMTLAFSKEGLAVQNLGMKGAKAANDLGILSAMFITKGLSGQSAGNNLRRLLDNITDPVKEAKIKMAALQYGIKVDFLKNGRFQGIENFVTQLEKLKGLNPEQLHSVLEPFSGKQGQSIDMVKFLATFGQVDFTEFKKFETDLIGINDEFAILKGTLKNIEKVKTTNIENLKAAIGGSMGNDLKRYNYLLGVGADELRKFVDMHPEAASIITELTAGLGLMGGLIGGLKMFAGMNSTFGAIAAGLTRAFGPLLLAAAAIELVKYNYDNAESNRKQHPGGLFDRNIGYFDEKIEAEKGKSGLGSTIRQNYYRYLKANENFSRGIFGDDWYEKHIGSDERESDRPRTTAEMEYSRTHTWGMPNAVPTSPGGSVSRGSLMDQWTSSGSNEHQLVYAPQITVPGGSGVDTAEVMSILDAHSEELSRMLDRVYNRKKNTTYGE